MTPEEKIHYEAMIQQEVKKQMSESEQPTGNPFLSEMYAVGGGAVGAGAGLASLNAIDVAKEQMSLRSADAKNREIEVWRKLKNISDGKDSWDTVHPSARETLRAVYNDHREFLADDASFKKHMDSIGPQTVYRIGQPESKGQILKRMLPDRKILVNLADNIQRPAVAAGALGGMTAGYYLGRMSEK